MDRSYGVGRYQAGEGDTVCNSRTALPGQRAVLRVPGRGATAATELVSGAAEHESITSRRLTLMEADWSGSQHWGSDTAQSRVGTGRSYVQAAPWSAKSGRVSLICRSMGTLAGLMWALANPTLVQAVALAIPAVGLIDIHDNNRGGYASEIETAYGGLSGWNAAKAAHDPLTHAAEFVGLFPIKLWYSDDDPICVKARQQEFIAATGCASQNMGAQGHATYAAFPAEAADFLAANA